MRLLADNLVVKLIYASLRGDVFPTKQSPRNDEKWLSCSSPGVIENVKILLFKVLIHAHGSSSLLASSFPYSHFGMCVFYSPSFLFHYLYFLLPVLKVTVERAFFAVSQLVRVSSIAVMTILIPYSLNPALYGITFKGLGLPDKFAYAMDLTMRFVPTFGRDFQLTMDAQRARGYELEKISGGLIAQVRKLGPIFVPVTIHAIIGSEDIIDAMDLRAFGVGPRTWLDVLTYQLRDRILIAVGVLILIVSIVLGIMGYGKFWVPEALIQMF